MTALANWWEHLSWSASSAVSLFGLLMLCLGCLIGAATGAHENRKHNRRVR